MGHGPRDPPCTPLLGPPSPLPSDQQRVVPCPPAGTGASSAGLPLPPRTEPGTGAAGEGGWLRGHHQEGKNPPGEDGTMPAQLVLTHCWEGKVLGPVNGSLYQHEIQT